MPWEPFTEPLRDPASIRFTVPVGWTLDHTGRCKTCKAPIGWCISFRSGPEWRPIDEDGRHHQATCPNAAFWRERAGREKPA